MTELLIATLVGVTSEASPLTRSFGDTVAQTNSAVVVTVTFTNPGPNTLRGFYYSDQVPSALTVATLGVVLNGRSVTNFTLESGQDGDVLAGCTPYRWRVESPTNFAEANPIPSQGGLQITYAFTSPSSGSFHFQDFSWAGYSPSITNASFGYGGIADQQTVSFFSEPPSTYPRLALDTAAIVFRTPQGLNPPSQTVGITNSGVGTLNWTIVGGSNAPAWLTVDPTNGVDAGTVVVSAASTSLTPGTYSNSITVTAAGAIDSPQIVTVILTVSQPPIANHDSYSVRSNATLNIDAPGVLGNDTDLDGDPLTAMLVSEPLHGTLTLSSNGGFVYVPFGDFSGVDGFTYQANDGIADSSAAEVSITVLSINDPPVAANDSYSVNEDAVLTVSPPGVLENDVDPTGQGLMALLVSGPVHGTLVLSTNGGFSYTPATNYHGPDSFSYRADSGITNSDVATVSLTALPVNDAPVANKDSYGVAAGVSLDVSASGVLFNDTDADRNTLAAILVSGTVHGTLSLNANGSFIYTPSATYSGPDSFTYKAIDGTATSAVTTVYLTVNGNGTIHHDFTYTNRASLLAAGWSFLARTAAGAVRNTEQISGPAVVNYDQVAHPGVLRIPVDTGDLWGTANSTWNSLFGDLPANWTSIRLKLSFAPTQNYQQAGLVAYQDDNNYVQLTRHYNGGQKMSFVRENGGSASVLQSVNVTATTDLHLRLDRNLTNGAISALYSLNGTAWSSVGSGVTQTLNNPRLAIVTGVSPSGYPNADLAWVEVIASQTWPLLAVSPANLTFSTFEGSDPEVQALGITNGGGGTLNWTAAADPNTPDWLMVSPTNGSGNAAPSVTVAGASLAPGVYSKGITVTAPGATNSPQTVVVNLKVNRIPTGLTINADPKTKVFGDPDPPLTWQITSGTLFEGDSFSGSLSRAAGENVGNYAIQQGTLTPGPDYVLTYVVADLVITKSNAPLTLNNLNQVYDAGAKYASATTIPGGLAVTFTYEGNSSAPTNAGSYELIGTVTEANYAGAATNTLTVIPHALSAVAGDASRFYGQTNPVFAGTLTGVQDGDNITAAYASPATTNSPAGSYDIVPTLIDPDGKLANYTVILTNGVLTIIDAPRFLSITESSEGSFTLVCQVCPGRTYQFQFKNSLSETNWMPLGGTNTATSSSLVFTNESGTSPYRFYRVLDITAP